MGHVVRISCLVLIIFCSLPFQSPTEARIGGFTIEIIPRHSKLSPFYNHSVTLRDRSRSDAFRSIARAKRFHSSSLDTKYIESTIFPDGSYTNGVLAVDIFIFDSTDGQRVALTNAMFGCGHNNGGNLGSGLVGLGAGPLSLISQLGRNIDYRFSYCLPVTNSASKLKFGGDAILSGPGVVSTPLTIYSSDTLYHYYLTLEGASVGNKKIVNSQTASNEGNIIIDSGTTLTMLESSFYNDLEAVLRETISLETIRDPDGNYHLCYDQRSFSNIPEMTVVFHFNGADVPLKKLNVFRPISTDLTCLAMLPTKVLRIWFLQASSPIRSLLVILA
ncbi:unnamed protein product [Thlaspi arvense]|uniref:Peptidase A1 domain-containing protein n=1 Tax=Thlaspi arvense TaxID=13288 RepID=A0AAU9SBP6_THLAR|nr:unnamed protein product [Thlaspi arvense]